MSQGAPVHSKLAVSRDCGARLCVGRRLSVVWQDWEFVVEYLKSILTIVG